MDSLLLASILSAALALALLLHHKAKHGNRSSPDYLPSPQEQWFQLSDIGNFQSHECYVVLLLSTSLTTALLSTLLLD